MINSSINYVSPEGIINNTNSIPTHHGRRVIMSSSWSYDRGRLRCAWWLLTPNWPRDFGGVLGTLRDQGDSVWRFAVGKEGDLDVGDRAVVVLGWGGGQTETSRAPSCIYLDRSGRRRRLGGRNSLSGGTQGIRGEGRVELRSLQPCHATLPKVHTATRNHSVISRLTLLTPQQTFGYKLVKLHQRSTKNVQRTVITFTQNTR